MQYLQENGRTVALWVAVAVLALVARLLPR